MGNEVPECSLTLGGQVRKAVPSTESRKTHTRELHPPLAARSHMPRTEFITGDASRLAVVTGLRRAVGAD